MTAEPAPFVFTDLIGLNSAFWALTLSLAMARSIENTTSSESKSEPSWNLTPWRSLKV